MLSVFRHNDATSSTTDRAATISRYKHLRSVGRDLSNKLVERLSMDVINEGARKLGILQGGTLVFDSEDESCVLMDYCIYNVRRRGRNAVEQYLMDSAPDPDSDEMVCLRAMQKAIYSLFIVESVERGLGMTARDLWSNETMLIVDMGLGSTAKEGVLFASRLLFHDGFSMTGGAVLPIGVPPASERDTIMKLPHASDADNLLDPAPLIRECLGRGFSSHVQYQEPSGHLITGRRGSLGSEYGKVGRNARCPCGSGKKFKHCCMKRS